MNSLQNKIKTSETKLAKLCVREDHVLEIRFKFNEYEVDVQDQIDIMKSVEEITDSGKTSHFILVIPGLYSGITPEARAMEMFSKKAFRNQKGIAIVVHALHHRLLAKFYLAIKKNKPSYPYLLFSKEEEAEDWLLKQV